MKTGSYHFAPIAKQPEALRKIQSLEKELCEEFGEEITLIAYTKDQKQNIEENPSPS